MSERQSYPTDLNDSEWKVLEPLVPPVRTEPRPAEHPRREIMNAILDVLRTGYQWRMLPHDFPPWGTVYTYYRNWRRAGTWQRIHAAVHQQVREAEGRHPQASAAILDSQSKDYEALCETSEGLMLIAMIHLMTKRLAKPQPELLKHPLRDRPEPVCSVRI